MDVVRSLKPIPAEYRRGNWGKEEVRFASVDNRSRSIWLLAGLGVLIWAAFSVFLSGSSAHAEETPGHASQQQTSSIHDRVGHAEQVARQGAARLAPGVTAAQRVTETASAPTRVADTTPVRITAPARLVAAQETAPTQPAPTQVSVTVLPTSGLMQRVEPRSLLPQAKAAVAPITEVVRRSHGDHHPHARAGRTDDRPAHAGAPLTHHAQADAHAHHAQARHAQHASPAASALLRTAHASAVASVTLAVASDDTAEHSPVDSRGTSTHHQPATAPSASSAAVGVSASPGVLPGTAHAGDVLGLLLTAAHADDDVLPSGPAGSTDNSPD